MLAHNINGDSSKCTLYLNTKSNPDTNLNPFYDPLYDPQIRKSAVRIFHRGIVCPLICSRAFFFGECLRVLVCMRGSCECADIIMFSIVFRVDT